MGKRLIAIILCILAVSGMFTASASALAGNVLLNYTTADRITIVKDYLINNLGFNKAAAAGIVANMVAESALKTNVYGDGGTSFGLCQWHNERFDALKQFAEEQGKPVEDIELQLEFFKHELETRYKSLYRALLSVDEGKDGAYECAYAVCVQFECPDDAYAKAKYRGRWAMSDFVYGCTPSSLNINELKIKYMLDIRANNKREIANRDFVVEMNCMEDLSQFDYMTSYEYNASYWEGLTADWDEITSGDVYAWDGTADYEPGVWVEDSGAGYQVPVPDAVWAVEEIPEPAPEPAPAEDPADAEIVS